MPKGSKKEAADQGSIGRLADLTKRIVAVPKKEIDRQATIKKRAARERDK